MECQMRFSGAYFLICTLNNASSRFTLSPHSPSSLKLLHSLRFKFSMVEWLRKNKASIHRTAQHFSIEGGHNSERKCCILRVSPPLRFVLKLKLQKRGHCCILRVSPLLRFVLKLKLQKRGHICRTLLWYYHQLHLV